MLLSSEPNCVLPVTNSTLEVILCTYRVPTTIFDAVIFCVTVNEPVTIVFPFMSSVELAYGLLIPTPDPSSNIELVVSVVALLNFAT